MYSRTFLLLQNEAYLSQGCLWSALAALLKSNNAERGRIYAALFNYSIGLEHLLKLALLLNHFIENKGSFPQHAQIKKLGHDVVALYKKAKVIADHYRVEIPQSCRTDDLDQRLLKLLADFADSGRYFNLNALTGVGKSTDPSPEWGELLAKVYERDVPRLKKLSDEDQVDALAASQKETTVYMPVTGFDGTVQSYNDFFRDHGKITLVMPEVVWRFVRILYPFQMLICELDMRLHSDQAFKSGDFPHLSEICAFCSEDKNSMLSEISRY